MPENTNIVWIVNEIFWDPKKKPTDDCSITSIMHELDKDFYIYGRHAKADFLSKDINVSRKHFHLRIENQQLLLKDLNSSNGVYLNGGIITPGHEYLLSSNDKIGIFLEGRIIDKFIVSQKHQVEPVVIDLSDDDNASSSSTIPVSNNQLLEIIQEQGTGDNVSKEAELGAPTTCPEPIENMRHKFIPKLRTSVNTNINVSNDTAHIVISDSDDNDPLRDIIRSFDGQCRTLYQDDDDKSDVKHFQLKIENDPSQHQPSSNHQIDEINRNQPRPTSSTHHQNRPSIVDRTIVGEIDEPRQYCPKLIISRRKSSVLEEDNCNSSYRIVNSLPDEPPKSKHSQKFSSETNCLRSRTSTKENCFTNIGQELASTTTAFRHSKTFSSRATIAADDDDLRSKSADIEEELLRTKSTAVRHCKMITFEDDSSHSDEESKNNNDQRPKSRQHFSSRATVAVDYDLHSKSIKPKRNSTAGQHRKMTTLADHSSDSDVESNIFGGQRPKSRQHSTSIATVAVDYDLHSKSIKPKGNSTAGQHRKTTTLADHLSDSDVESNIFGDQRPKSKQAFSSRANVADNHDQLDLSNLGGESKNINFQRPKSRQHFSSRATVADDYDLHSKSIKSKWNSTAGRHRKTFTLADDSSNSDVESKIIGDQRPKSKQAFSSRANVADNHDQLDLSNLGGESKTSDSRTSLQELENKSNSQHLKCISTTQQNSGNHPELPTISDDDQRKSRSSSAGSGKRKLSSRQTHYSDDEDYVPTSQLVVDNVTKTNRPRRSSRVPAAKSRSGENRESIPDLFMDSDNESNADGNYPKSRKSKKKTSMNDYYTDGEFSPKSSQTNIQVLAPRKSRRCSSRKSYVEFIDQDDFTDDEIQNKSVSKTNKTSKKIERNLLSKPDDQNLNKKTSDDIDEEILKKSTSNSKEIKSQLENQNSNERTTSTKEINEVDHQISKKSVSTEPRRSGRCSARRNYVEFDNRGDDEINDDILLESVNKTYKTSKKKETKSLANRNKPDDIDKQILNKFTSKSKETKPLVGKHKDQNLNEKSSTSINTNHNSNERIKSTKDTKEFDHRTSEKSNPHLNQQVSENSSDKNKNRDKAKEPERSEHRPRSKQNRDQHDPEKSKSTKDNDQKSSRHHSTSKSRKETKADKDSTHNAKSDKSKYNKRSTVETDDESNSSKSRSHKAKESKLEEGSSKNRKEIKNVTDDDSNPSKSRSHKSKESKFEEGSTKKSKESKKGTDDESNPSKSRSHKSKESKQDEGASKKLKEINNVTDDESNSSKKSTSHKSKESTIEEESSKISKEIKNATDDESNSSKSTSQKSKEIKKETDDESNPSKSTENDESPIETDNNQDKNDQPVDELDLNNIKLEPVRHYTDQDIIEISDDESQLFHEQKNDSVDQLVNNNQDDERYDDIYDHLTSDEEPSEDEICNKNWYLKLSQSQDITASKVFKEKKLNLLKLDDDDLIYNESPAKTIEPVEEVDNEAGMHQEPTEINVELPSPVPSEINSELPSPVPTELNIELPSPVPTEIKVELPSPVPTEINNELPSPVPTELDNELPSPIPTEINNELPSFIPLETVKEVEKKKYVVPPVIDAPFLHKGKRKAPESTAIPAKRDRCSTTTNEHQSSVRTTRATSTANPLINKEFKKRNRKRRNSSTDTISGDTKKEMQEARRLKLKEISTKQSENRKDEPVLKVYVKPKVKMTDKTRGDFLADRTTDNRPKRRVSTDERKAKVPKRNPIPVDVEPVPAQSPDVIVVVRKKKTVTFNLEMNKVHSYDLVEELPNRNVFQPCPTEYETIYTNVLIWNPVWLEQQKAIKEPPKVSNRSPTQMQYTFKDTLEYYNNVTPLMLLELWKSISRTWEERPHQEVIMASIDKVRPYKANVSTVDCHLILTDHQTRYKFGDLLIVEMKLKGRKIAKKFGLITNLKSKRLSAPDVINPALINSHGSLPPLAFLVRLEMLITKFEGEFDDYIMKTRLITPLPPHLRLFKSVSNLHKSPLCNLVLRPNVDDYKLPKMRQMTLSRHLSKQLDSWQTRCVVQSYEFCKRSEPGIYMIQGPPGTGKTLVIQNIILQLLFGQQDKSDIRVLICTPSNAAIDDLVLKLLELRRSVDKDRLKVVRLGQKDSMHPQVARISVPELAAMHQHRLQAGMKHSDAYTKNVNLHEDRINSFKKQMNDTTDMDQRDILQRKLRDEERELRMFQNRQSSKFADRDKMRNLRKAEETIICGANVICSTLSACMHMKMEEICKKNKLKFTCCIIDESTQSSEQDNLLPLLLDIDKLILVGDKEQLPSTILSQEAKMFGHGKSLFSRIQTNLDHHENHPIQMLKTQYRMHPEICSYPNKTSYYGKLETAVSVMNRPYGILHPYRILSFQTNVNFKEEHINSLEVNVIKILCCIIREETDYNIGIITPYAKQRDLILHHLQPSLDSKISVNTIDGFQGQERDVIIFSTVRFKPNRFLEDRQRLNVAITRAKYALFILAHSQLFRQPGDLTDLYNDAFARQLAVVVSDEYVNDKRFMTKIICRK